MPTIISCAVTGNITTRENHPELPCTPQEIAKACIDSAKAGAAVVHIHVRYPDGRPSMELGHYRETVERIRDSGTDVIINLTTGPGQRFIPSADDPKVAAPGTTLTTPERRVEHIVALKPDICSLDFNTMYSGSSVVINTPQSLRSMARMIREAGTKPELECFDSGDIQLARDLLADGTLDGDKPFFQLVLGIKYGAIPTTQTMAYLASLLPQGAVWSGFGVGRFEYPMLAQAWLLGGHVRVGLEDNVFIRKGVLAPDNAALVTKAATIVDALGGQVASVAQAREILGLKPR
jgi:uncharacterized protein (DUF849 family)